MRFRMDALVNAGRSGCHRRAQAQQTDPYRRRKRRTREGRAVTVRGNPDHPVNRGKLCPKGLSEHHTLAAPGRALYPMLDKRRVSWDVALDTMVARIRQQVKDAPGKFEETIKKLGDKIGPKATWLHLELATPQCIPADSTGGRYEIVHHLKGSILYEMSGTNLVQTGELVLVGAAWRLTGGP